MKRKRHTPEQIIKKLRTTAEEQAIIHDHRGPLFHLGVTGEISQQFDHIQIAGEINEVVLHEVLHRKLAEDFLVLLAAERIDFLCIVGADGLTPEIDGISTLDRDGRVHEVRP